jgi:hypothetical protein
MPTISAYAKLNARIMPMDRGERFEDPLSAAFAENGLGAVTGGGTMQSQSGEIEYCGIDIDLAVLSEGSAFVRQFLTEHGAPKGSELQYELDGQHVDVPFGVLEGIAIYLNGTDLPDAVYQECDVNVVYNEINRLLGDLGSIQGHWQGPTETALYLYGSSADEMAALIAGFLAEYPLCQGARVVRIA